MVINEQIFATFLFIFPSSWRSFSAWDWADIVATALVAIGCFMEGCWLFKKGPPKECPLEREEFEEKKLKHEKLWGIVVAIGVLVFLAN